MVATTSAFVLALAAPPPLSAPPPPITYTAAPHSIDGDSHPQCTAANCGSSDTVCVAMITCSCCGTTYQARCEGDDGHCCADACLQRCEAIYCPSHTPGPPSPVPPPSPPLAPLPPSLPPIPPLKPAPSLPPSTPLPPSPPMACSASCEVAGAPGAGSDRWQELPCHLLRSLPCLEAERITRSLSSNCTACDGCCTIHAPSPPPPPLSPPLPPPPALPPSPAFPSASCPWVNASSREEYVLVCFDGTRCSMLVEGHDCCGCRGGRAQCPLNYPVMCASPTCEGLDYHCCVQVSQGCDDSGGARNCTARTTSLSRAAPPRHCMPSPPTPPNLPPLPPMPPAPPASPYDYDWRRYFRVFKPEGFYCDVHVYDTGDYKFLPQPTLTYHWSHSACADRCLRRHGCTGFEFPGDNAYCSLWFNGACSSMQSSGVQYGPKHGPHAKWTYVRVFQPPPAPVTPPGPPSPPPPPLACDEHCGSDESILQCRALIRLSCAHATEITQTIGCTRCRGCCTDYPPSPPPLPALPPPAPPPAWPPSPSFPARSCPWVNATSGATNVLVCFDGSRCDWVEQGFSCCACRGGRAMCPINRTMCADPGLTDGVDYDCLFECSKRGGERPCQPSGGTNRRVPPRGFCTPSPPLPPSPPPAPPSLPFPPSPPYQYDATVHFHMLTPHGVYCDLLDYTIDVDWSYSPLPPSDPDVPVACANACLQTPQCTGFQALGHAPYCILWFRGACSSSSSRGIVQGQAAGKASIIQYVRSSSLMPILIPTTSTVGLLVCIGFAIAYQRQQKRMRLALMANEREREEARKRFSSIRRRGSAERLTRFYARIEAQIRAATRGLGTRAATSDASTYAKFNSEPEQLVFGKPTDAVHGIGHFMKVAEDSIHAGMARGVDAIVDEFERGGTDEDRECLNYVLRERAGSSSLTFENSPFPRDCDANGLRADRKKLNGEGMRLSDFVSHPHSAIAKLQAAHVLALRLYTTSAYSSINNPLRELAAGTRSEPHPLPVTVAFISDAIRKLRAVAGSDAALRTRESLRASVGERAQTARQRLRAAALTVMATLKHRPPPTPVPVSHANMLWRGLRNRQVGGEFFKKGGTELAPMSCTTSIEVALDYCASSSAVLLCIHCATFMRRGADLAFLSAFPMEAEVLFPPLTYLKLADKHDEPRTFMVPVDGEDRTLTFTVLVMEPDLGG